MKIEDIKRGEVTVPELVTTFPHNLIGGPDFRRWESNFKKIRIKSMSEDAVFAATAGLKTPKKYLMLGIALKSLTGHRKVIEIMNRPEHCASYHTIENVEPEATFESTKRNLVTFLGVLSSSSPKSNLMKYLETFAVSETPEVVHETIIDAMFFLRLHVNLPNTIEVVVRYILGRIVNCEGGIIHFVCNKGLSHQ